LGGGVHKSSSSGPNAAHDGGQQLLRSQAAENRALAAVTLPATLSDTWVSINRKLLASQRMAAQNFHASRSRVEALRHSLARRRMQFQAERKKRREAQLAARLLVGLGHHDDTLNFVLGAALFGVMAFIAGAAPGLIPLVYVAFFLYMMPARTAYFIKRKWAFFLIDFCYWANTATTVVLLFYPLHDKYAALVFAMNEGPLAGALVVWQCAWVFGSREHTFSALMHLLPGLAVHCNRYYLGPKGAPAVLASAKALTDGSDARLSWTRLQISNMGLGWQWHILYPLLFYCGWQLGYFLVVQVLLRKFIRDNKYETSYTMLAQRAAKTNNFWNRLIRQGSTMRRISLFGRQLHEDCLVSFRRCPLNFRGDHLMNQVVAVQVASSFCSQGQPWFSRGPCFTLTSCPSFGRSVCCPCLLRSTTGSPHCR